MLQTHLIFLVYLPSLLSLALALKCQTIIPDLRYKYLKNHIEIGSQSRNKTNLLKTNFFHVFPKEFLFGFLGPHGKENVTAVRYKVLHDIAKINTNYTQYNLTKPLEVWPAFYHPENTNRNLTEFMDLLHSINAKAPNTATHFVFVYNCATSLNRLLVTQVELKEISKAVSRENATFGLLLPIDVCEENSVRLKALPLQLVESITFAPSEPEKVYYEDGMFNAAEVKSLLQRFEECRQNIKNRFAETHTKLGFATNLVLKVKTDKQGNCESAWFTKYIDMLWPENQVSLLAHIKQIDNGPDLMEENLETPNTWGSTEDIAWVKTRPALIDTFIGYSISVEPLPPQALPDLANSEIRKHHNILLENYEFQKLQSDSQVSKVIKLFSKSETYPDSNVWLNINLEKISTLEKLQEALVQSTLSAIVMNRENHVTAVTCLVFKLPLWAFHLERLKDRKLKEIFEFLQEMGDARTRPEIGIDVSTTQCLNANTNRNESFWTHVDFVIISDSVGMEAFKSENPHSVTQGIILELTTCKQHLKQMLVNNGIQQVNFHVKIYGCQGNYTDLNQIAPYGVLVHGLHIWSNAQTTLTFISDGFEYDYPNKSETCQNGHLESCNCGWWIVSPDEKLPDGYTILDKKSLAWKIYDNQNSTILSTIRWLFVITSLLIFIIMICRILQKPKKMLDYYMGRNEILDFLNGFSHKIPKDSFRKGGATAESLPYQRDLLELPKSSFEIDESKLISVSSFTNVYKTKVAANGKMTDAIVKAAKERGTTNCNNHLISMRSLLSEIKILSYLGSHERIVGLVGANTEQIHKGRLYVILNYCELGSLHDYLQSIKPFEVTEHSEVQGDYVDVRPDIGLYKDLSRWALEVAEGMEYIASKTLVHADLATRNVLLTLEKSAKIADFGLSRRLDNYLYYIKSHDDPMPWRWMAPEALKRFKFNEKTDVWSYGVTLWEMYSLGNVPYSGLSWNVNFPAQLEKDLRLEQPLYSVDGIYTVMLHCWNINPSKRPTFTQIKEMLPK